MAEEKDVPIKEQDDGSVLAKVEAPEGFDDDEEGKQQAGDSGSDDGDGGDNDDHGDEAGDDGDDDERERIREARREERRLKKDLAKQRENSARNKISALERRNEELARRLAAVESTASSYQFAQIDKAIEDEATRVEYAKMKMMQAAQAGDAASQVEYLEQLTEAKQRLIDLSAGSEIRFANEWIEGELGLPVCPCLSPDLYSAYQAYCRKNGESRPRTAVQFFSQLTHHGFEKKKARVYESPTSAQTSVKNLLFPPQANIDRFGNGKEDAETPAKWLTRTCRRFTEALVDSQNRSERMAA